MYYFTPYQNNITSLSLLRHYYNYVSPHAIPSFMTLLVEIQKGHIRPVLFYVLIEYKPCHGKQYRKSREISCMYAKLVITSEERYSRVERTAVCTGQVHLAQKICMVLQMSKLQHHMFWPDRPLAQTDLGIHSLLASLLMLNKRILSLMPHYAGLQTVY